MNAPNQAEAEWFLRRCLDAVFRTPAADDYAIAAPWSLNVDVKKLWVNTGVKANVGSPLKADVDINPWIFGVGLRYRF